jgi:hypothetical protein
LLSGEKNYEKQTGNKFSGKRRLADDLCGGDAAGDGFCE